MQGISRRGSTARVLVVPAVATIAIAGIPARRSSSIAISSASARMRNASSTPMSRRFARPVPSNASAFGTDMWTSAEAYTAQGRAPSSFAGALASRAIARPIRFADDPHPPGRPGKGCAPAQAGQVVARRPAPPTRQAAELPGRQLQRHAQTLVPLPVPHRARHRAGERAARQRHAAPNAPQNPAGPQTARDKQPRRYRAPHAAEPDVCGHGPRASRPHVDSAMSPAFVGLNPQLPNTGPTGLSRPGCWRDVRRHNVASGLPLAHRQQHPPGVFHTSESGRVSGWNLNLSPAVFSFVYAAVDAPLNGRAVWQVTPP